MYTVSRNGVSVDSAEEARRLVRLLWRDQRGADESAPRRGPRPKFTVDEVVHVAIALADEQGLAALTMRSVAARLGVRAMALYTYVPSRNVLVALMLDRVAADDEVLARLADGDDAASLLAALRAMAAGIRAEVHAHPWVLDVSNWRQVLGPHRLRRYDRQLALIEEFPFTDVERDRVVATVTALATASARQERAAVGVVGETGMGDGAWWEIVGPELSAVMKEEDFPYAARVGAVAGEEMQAPADPLGNMAFAVEYLADGLMRVIESRG